MRIGISVAVLVACVCGPAFGQTELVTNGGFELVMDPWVETGDAGAIILTDATRAHTGLGFLQMGARALANEEMYQTITFPTNVIDSAFRFYYNYFVNQGASALTFDAALTDTNGAILTNMVFGTLSSSDPARGNPYYHLATFRLAAYTGQTNLAPFAGRTVRLAFFAATDAGGAGAYLSIDDASLVVGTTDDIPTNDNFADATVLADGVTMATNYASNAYATKEPGEPNHAGNAGGKSVWWRWTAPTNGTLVLDTLGSSFPTLLAVYTGSSVSNLVSVASSNGVNSGRGNGAARVQFQVSAGTQYWIAVDGVGGAGGAVTLMLNFHTDSKPPSVTITSPQANARLAGDAVVVQGRASDSGGVVLVEYQLENVDGTTDFQAATGTTRWSASLTNLVPGPNTVRVHAFDTSGNMSATVSRKFYYVVLSPLHLTVTGSGRVSPNLAGRQLEVGRTYTVRGKPGAGYIFGSWSGAMDSEAAKLTFLMQTNLVLQANFVPNPFIPVAAVYQGLFADSNGVAVQSAGFFNGRITRQGRFTARVQLAGGSYPMSGQFSASGFWSNAVPRRGLAPLSVSLQVDLNGGGGLTGTINDGTWTAGLVAVRSGFSSSHPSPQAGKYTLLFPGADAPGTEPGGDGFATLAVDSRGNVKLAGALADGSRVTEGTVLSDQGAFPVWFSPYHGHGVMLGWLTITNSATNDVEGDLTWIKSPQPAAYYPEGFTNRIHVMGSAYQFSRGIPVLDFGGETGRVWLANGNLPQSFTNQVMLDSNNKVTSTNRLVLHIMTASGRFNGRVASPAGQMIPFNGVILQKLNFGSGYFLGTSQAGRVYFGP